MCSAPIDVPACSNFNIVSGWNPQAFMFISPPVFGRDERLAVGRDWIIALCLSSMGK